jgi:endonuclease YncB( thermonuclease family)
MILRSTCQRAAITVFAATVLSALPASAAAKQTFTGEVGDAMCGRKHMEGKPADCTRTCVAHGSKYALVVHDNGNDKMYVLDTTDPAALAALDEQAGKNATVTGTLDGDTISVRSVVAAK